MVSFQTKTPYLDIFGGPGNGKRCLYSGHLEYFMSRWEYFIGIG
jgi:hypothetical protein